MVAQSRSRVEGKADFAKHMIRLRHAAQVNAKGEANEIILINSHDGASSYQMLAGMFRFVCCNGMACLCWIVAAACAAAWSAMSPAAAWR